MYDVSGMKILFKSYWVEECMAWLEARPKVNGMIEKDRFSGKYHVLDLA